jgi:ABC-type uncharacterized transport system substrate-binding protein
MTGHTKLLIVFFIYSASLLHAHPHMFVKGEIEPLTEGDMLKAVRIIWTWDERSSMDMIYSFDLDLDGKYSAAELDELAKYYFHNLKNFSYFTELYFNGNRINFSSASGFAAAINKNYTVTYSFILPVNRRIDAASVLKVRFNDDTFFVAFDKNINYRTRPGIRLLSSSSSVYKFYGCEAVFNIQQ